MASKTLADELSDSLLFFFGINNASKEDKETIGKIVLDNMNLGNFIDLKDNIKRNFNKILSTVFNNKFGIISDLLKTDTHSNAIDDFIVKVDNLNGAKIMESKKTPTIKPSNLRFKPGSEPRAGAFKKDTKAQLAKKNPGDRRVIKHKGKTFESEEKFILDESVLGMSSIPSISRLQALAGIEEGATISVVGLDREQTCTPTAETKMTEAYSHILGLLNEIKQTMPQISVREYRELQEIMNSFTDMDNDAFL